MSTSYKTPYQCPKINVILIHLEYGIAASSATLKFGGFNSDYPDQPLIEDWEKEGEENNGFDIL